MWETLEDLAARRAEFEAALGAEWRAPAVFGIGHVEDGGFVLDRANLPGEGGLVVSILATVTGYRAGTCSLPVGAADLDRAIALLEPAEACAEARHPNLVVWRLLRDALGDDGVATAVFAERLDGPEPEDPAVRALLAEIHRGRVENADGTTTLWRPVGPAELESLRASGMRAWPARLPEQPIFYPVLNEDYAAEIARDWNVSASGSGHVIRFRVRTSFARRYPTRQAGGPGHLELWVPAEDLTSLNEHIVGEIEVVGDHV